jgi:hypothetical protein
MSDDLKDRRNLKVALNEIANKYKSVKDQMDKLGTSTPEQKAKLRELATNKAKALLNEADDLHRLNQGKDILIQGGKNNPVNPNEIIAQIPGGPDNVINTNPRFKELTGDEYTSKISALRKLAKSPVAKKIAGVIPFAGTAFAALSGDPAMAAEQAAYDATGPIGMAAEALSPSESGNPEEEKMMLSERNAMEKYKKSPARQSKLKAMMEGRSPASDIESLKQAEKEIKDANPLPNFNEGIPGDKFDEVRRKILDQRQKDSKLARNLASEEEDRGIPAELSLDQPPALSARDKDLNPEKIAPDMQDMIRNKLQQAEEMKPEEVRAMRLRRLMGK